MVITNKKWCLIHSQEKNTFTTVGDTDTFSRCYYMHTFTMFNSYSLANSSQDNGCIRASIYCSICQRC
uniref:Putative ovule protein n=1 Tax=Solanum chacoense TaxID=4108 RepID=A0A0V0HTQ7_SOLCH